MCEAVLQLSSHSTMIANEVARLYEEVQEVETAGFRLQAVVIHDSRLQSLVQERGEISFARGDEGLQVGPHAISAGQYFVACQISEGCFRPSLVLPTPKPTPVPGEFT